MSGAWQPQIALALGPLLAEIDFSIDWGHLATQVVTTLIFLIIGLAFFALSDWMVERVLPRSLRKGIEEDKNVALAIVIAAVIIGVALIVSAAIRG
jgi:hypothetical protein